MKKKSKDVYTIKKNVECVKCKNKGAVQYYGEYFPTGIGATELASYKKYENSPFLGHAMGFGGTIPYECLNCGNQGLIDFGGLEGYKMAFRTIELDEPTPSDNTNSNGGSGLQMF